MSTGTFRSAGHLTTGSALLVALAIVGMVATQGRADDRQDPTPSGSPPAYTFFEPALFDAFDGENQLYPRYSALGDIGSYNTGYPNNHGPQDTWLDVVVAANDSGGDSYIVVYRNSQNWSGDPPSNGLRDAEIYDVTSYDRNIYGVTLADFNVDGYLDIAASFQRNGFGNDYSPLVVIFYNDGVGRFDVATPTEIPIYNPNCVDDLCVDDVFGITSYNFHETYSRPDILVSGVSYWFEELTGYPAVWYIWQDGSGTITVVDDPPYAFPESVDPEEVCGRVATDVAVAKLKTGGSIPTARRDAVVSIGQCVCMPGPGGEACDGEWVGTLTNNSTGTDFEEHTTAGVDSFSIAAARLRTSVTRQDAASGRIQSPYNDEAYRYFTNTTGELVLQTTPSYPGAEDPLGVAMGTIDANSLIDITIAFQYAGPFDGSSGCIATLFTTSSGGVTTIRRYNPTPGLSGAAPTFVRVADMDQDGCQDAVVSCTGLGLMSVLINRGTCATGEGFMGGGEGGPGSKECEGIDEPPCQEYEGYSWNSIVGPFDFEED